MKLSAPEHARLLDKAGMHRHRHGSFRSSLLSISRFLPAHAGILSPMLVFIVLVAAVLVREQHASSTCVQQQQHYAG